MESPRPQRTSVVKHEPRWHASIAVLVALALYITLPPRLTIGPVWVAPLAVMLILIPLSIIAPRRHKETSRIRIWGIILIGIVNFFNVASVVLLIHSFFHPSRTAEVQSAATLLLHGMQIWITNILVFALWYWEVDAGGPDARAHAPTASEMRHSDFLFPQMSLQSGATAPIPYIDEDWKPQFLDYLYVAFVNSSAFSPADTMPISRLAKMLLVLEASISLVTIAVVLARSVSLIQ